MRTLKISLLVFILSITLSAQWYQQTSPNGITLYAVSFVDANNGWAVGPPPYEGTIIKTIDGGENWVLQPNSSGSGSLTGVNF